MIFGVRTDRRGQRSMMASAFAEMATRAFDDGCASRRDVDGGQSADGGSVVAMPASLQRLARQVQAADRRIFIEVAQDIGQLQRPAEVMGQFLSLHQPHSENLHAQPSDCARNPVAIKIEKLEFGCADVLYDVHFHPVDDGKQVVPVEPKIAAAVARPCSRDDGLPR